MVLLFLLGAVLIAIEFMMPGFGVAGTIGIISLLLGIVIASQVVSPPVLVGMIVIALLIIVGLLIWAYRSAVKGGRISKTLLLRSRLNSEQGYSSVPNRGELLGKEGLTLSLLRPTGQAEIDGRRVDVITNGEFIPKGTRVKVVQVEGFRIVVERVKTE
jgi:membrane-bound serine protease (ClpP class)